MYRMLVVAVAVLLAQRGVAGFSVQASSLTDAMRLVIRAQELDATGRSSVTKRSVNACNTFVKVPNALAMSSQIMRLAGEGLSPLLCQEACINTTAFVCGAVQVQRPATCYLSGYTLRDDFYSTHYQRICTHGPGCFRATAWKSGGFTQSRLIPSYFVRSANIQAMYCMAWCERMLTCVGFDLRRDGQARCVFLDFGIYNGASFDLYIRRCRQ